MSKIRPGNKQNSFINGEWAAHVRADYKKITAGKRRMIDKKVIREQLTDEEYLPVKKKSKKKPKIWIKEYKWKSKFDYHTQREWFWRKGEYTDEWQAVRWGKFPYASAVKNSITSQIRNKYSRPEVLGRYWRARNIVTGEIVEFPNIENYYE